MHFPRGSNNRLNEQAANRDNANRLFDSQNNNRGGHNCGDLDTEEGFNANDYIATANLMYDFEFFYENDANHEKQSEALFFEKSWVSTTWTNQHGTGNKKLNSHIVLQFICDTFERADSSDDDSFGQGPDANVATVAAAATNGVDAETFLYMKQHGLRVELYNGGNTNTPDDEDNAANIQGTYEDNHNDGDGRRESEEYYYLCNNRYRNYGLFHADQDLEGDTEIYTRQNPGGTRRGLECPEERDYYPWWRPSPFHDIAIITPDVTYCESDLAPNSQNVAYKYECILAAPEVTATTDATYDDPDDYLVTDDDNLWMEAQYNQTYCELNAGEWHGFRWGMDTTGTQPECVDSYWTKTNYLGNADDTPRGGMQAKYDWQIPTLSELKTNHFCWEYTYTVGGDEYVEYSSGGGFTTGGVEDATTHCVRMMFRIRYNMSTSDYDPYKTNSSMDYDDNAGIVSPIEQNPEVDVGVYAQGLQLAINTAQTGRTFQDCSHTFLVCERPSGADTSYPYEGNDADGWPTVQNIGVRGKRGNIVQTFPAVEYDFEPKHVQIAPGQCMHFQWEGSNTHNNGNPAGDGQAGDAGEGRGGSDRSNIAQMYSMQESYPLTYDKFDPDFFTYVTCYHPLFPDISVTSEDAQLILGSAGFYRSVGYADSKIQTTSDQGGLLDELLNNVSGAFRQGLMCCVNSGISFDSNDSNDETDDATEVRGDNDGTNDSDEGNCVGFAFLSTRNNNFSNRAQKLYIEICTDEDDIDTDNW